VVAAARGALPHRGRTGDLVLGKRQRPRSYPPVASAGVGEGEKTLRLAMNGRDSADTQQTHGSGP